MTVKSAPAMARIVPPFSAYGLNCLCCGLRIADMSGIGDYVGEEDGRGKRIENGRVIEADIRTRRASL